MRNKSMNPFTEKEKTLSYKVNTASDIIATTIVPKCWVHAGSISKKLQMNNCVCNNPDLFGQRVKGWFLSEHRFFFRYLQTALNFKDFTKDSIWIRIVILYDALFLANQYIAFGLAFLFIRYAGLWLIEGLIIGMAFNVFVLLIFNQFFLRPNGLNVPLEVITLQPIIYKLFIVTIYKYLALFYNLLIYTPTHRNGQKIKKRIEDFSLREEIDSMYTVDDISSTDYLEFDNYSVEEMKSFASSGCKNLNYKTTKKPKKEPYIIGNVDDIAEEAEYDKVIVLKEDSSLNLSHLNQDEIDQIKESYGSNIDLDSIDEVSFV